MSQRFHLVYVVADEDILWSDRLDRHLRPLQRQGLLTTWSSQQMQAGAERQKEWETQIAVASIIVLLISPDFIASDECVNAIQKAQVPHKQIIPVFIHPAIWHLLPISHLSPLPQNGKPIALWSNRDAGLLEVANAIHDLIDPYHTMARSPAPLSITPDRQRFLARLRSRYTEVLKQSLLESVPITLKLHTNLDALELPTDRMFRHLHQCEQELPTGIPILRVYDRVGGELLILGEPGAGKSILLLHLAQDLLTRAEANSQQFPPVILNLSSWAEKRQSIEEWLIEELWVSYQIPLKFGQLWVQTEQFLPFLDGLDELPSSALSACIEAINNYRKNHLVSPVVCSRTTDYFSQQQRLMLECAIAIQPLTQEQIDSYVVASGPSFAAVHTVLQQNSVLNELVASPLMLNIVTQAYRDASVDVLPKSGSQEEQQQQIFAHYVRRMVPSPHETGQRTRSQCMLERLTWLARQMRQHNQTTFYLEQLQSSWLPTAWLQYLYDMLAVRFPAMFIGLLVGILASSFFLSPTNLASWGSFIIPSGLLGYLFSGINISQRSTTDGEVTQNTSWQRHHLQLLMTVLVGPTYGLIAMAISRSPIGLAVGLSFGLIYGLLHVSLGKINLEQNHSQLSLPIRKPRWHRPFSHLWIYYGLAYGLISGLALGPNNGLLFGLTSAIVYGVLRTLLEKINLAELSLRIPFLMRRTQSRWLIRSPEVRNGLLIALVPGLVVGLSFAFVIGLVVGFVLVLALIYLHGATLSKVTSAMFVIFPYGLFSALALGLAFTLVFGVSGGLLNVLLVRQNTTVQTTDRLIWSWRRLGQALFSITVARNILFVGLFLGLLALIVALSQTFYPQAKIFSFGRDTVLSLSLTFGLNYWLLFGLFQGVSGETIDAQYKTLPNEGIRRSIRNGVVLGLMSFIIVGLISILISWLSHQVLSILSFQEDDTLNDWLIHAVSVAVSAGVLVALLNGLLAYLRHSVLRLLLWWTDCISWNYIRFLDQGVRCIFLYKVGGGYTFIHRQFRDYIANQNLKEDENASTARPYLTDF